MGFSGKRLCKQQTQATNTTHDPHRHDKPNQQHLDKQHERLKPTTMTKPTTTKTTTATHHSSSPNSSEVDPPQEHSNHNQQTNKTAYSAPATLFIVSDVHVLFQHRYRPTSFQVARGLSRCTWVNCFCTVRKQETGQGPRTLALRASQNFVYRELIERMINCHHCHYLVMLVYVFVSFELIWLSICHFFSSVFLFFLHFPCLIALDCFEKHILFSSFLSFL